MARIKVGQPLRLSASNVGQPFLAVLLLLLSAGSLSPAQAQETTPPIRVTVNRVNVGVTATDSSGHFISGLHPEDFQLLDNGVEQPITDFLPIEEPAQLLLLIESGPAVLLFSKSHLLAADALLATVAPTDHVAIATYSRSPRLLLDFTSNKAEARAALRDINFGSGYADLNLSSSLAATIDWLAPLPGKKTIVLLSTGVVRKSARIALSLNMFSGKLINGCASSLIPPAAAPISRRTPKTSPTPTPKSPS